MCIILNIESNEIILFDSYMKIKKQQVAETGFQRIDNPQKYKNTETTNGRARFSKNRQSTEST